MIKLIDSILYWFLDHHLAKKAGQQALQQIELGNAFVAGCSARVAAKYAFQSHPHLRSW